MMTTYADSGVNIELGDDVSKILYNAAKETWKNRNGKLGELIAPVDDFSGVRAIDVGGLPKGTMMNIGFDGVGTKMEIAERIGDHTTIAHDLFAMVCDDAVVRGAEPVLIGSILDVNSLGKDGKPYLEQVKQLARGYVDAARAANVAIVNGEVAELSDRVGGYGGKSFCARLAHEYISVNLEPSNWRSIRMLSAYVVARDPESRKRLISGMDIPEQEFANKLEAMQGFNYNWGAAVVWFAKKDRMFTGSEVKEGDWLVGFKEEGFRSNGLSLVRRILTDVHGPEWHKEDIDSSNIGVLALQPSRIYSAAVVDMLGGVAGEPKCELHAVAHITGGGLPGKLGRVLKASGLGAKIDDPLMPCFLMHYCQEKGHVSDAEAYRTWNMGSGMVVATPKPDEVITTADAHNIYARVIGRVTADKGIKVRSNGFFNTRKYLVF